MKMEKHEIIGEAFEDKSFIEMSKDQGIDDVNLEASPVVATTIATAGETLTTLGIATGSGVGAGAATIQIARTAKNHC